MNRKMEKMFIVLLAICFMTHLIRSVYEFLKYKKIIKPNKVSFVIIFTNMVILWISWFLMCKYDSHKINISGTVCFSGLLLIGVGLGLFLTALFSLRGLENNKGELVTTGIYAKLRHPMYIGFMLWLIGAPLFFESLFSMFISVAFILNVLYWRYIEEKELQKRFDSYITYKRSTIF